jgi:hypothetical protein
VFGTIVKLLILWKELEIFVQMLIATTGTLSLERATLLCRVYSSSLSIHPRPEKRTIRPGDELFAFDTLPREPFKRLYLFVCVYVCVCPT